MVRYPRKQKGYPPPWRYPAVARLRLYLHPVVSELVQCTGLLCMGKNATPSKTAPLYP